jgi:hypothetical protein
MGTKLRQMGTQDWHATGSGRGLECMESKQKDGNEMMLDVR